MSSRSIAIVFPGQGSQSVGMLAALAVEYPLIRDTFAQASAILGYDLWQLTQQGPSEILDQTQYTQPALLVASYALWRVLQQTTQKIPIVLAGHSLGEYTALLCAQALDFSDAVKLVEARGRYMQEAVQTGEGAMAALIGLHDEQVLSICRDISSQLNAVLSPANYNSVGQVVVAGHREAVLQAIVFAKEQGAKIATLIPVSVPSHCELMRPAAARLETLLNTIQFRETNIPVINNTDVQAYNSILSIREGLVKQLYQPVRWVETIQYFIHQGVNTILECGPGKVLTGLNKRIDKTLHLMSMSEVEDFLYAAKL